MARKFNWNKNDRDMKLVKLITDGYSRSAIYERIVNEAGLPSFDAIKRRALKLGYGVKGDNFVKKPDNYPKKSHAGVVIDISAIGTPVEAIVATKPSAPDKDVEVDLSEGSEAWKSILKDIDELPPEPVIDIGFESPGFFVNGLMKLVKKKDLEEVITSLEVIGLTHLSNKLRYCTN